MGWKLWHFNATLVVLFSSVGLYLFDSRSSDENLIVSTNYGKVEGYNAVSRNGREYYGFMGIPYAKPPVDELRFAPPVFPEPWNETRDATYMRSKCLQMDMMLGIRMGNENCLFLNVFTHQIQNTKADVAKAELRPVILFIHGGLFMFGGVDFYRPKYFMDEDIVLVTFHYRLGALGFLNFGHKDAAGNMGLKDQVKALQWIQENVQYFGGDPNRVTILGASAGGASAHYHMLSNQSRGLFHRAISQSGSALSHWALRQKPLKQAKTLATKVNCQRKSTAETIACLKKLDGNIIVNTHIDATVVLREQTALFGPTVEIVKNSETFLSDLPVNVIKSRTIPKVPWLIGCNSEEGILFSSEMIRNSTARNELNTNWMYWAPIFLEYSYEPQPKKDEISRRIWNYYINQSESGDFSMESRVNVTNLMSDRVFFSNLHYLANLKQDSGDAPLFLYFFTYPVKFGLGRLLFELSGNLPVVIDVAVTIVKQWFSDNILRRPKIKYGVCHLDETFLQFNLPFQQEHMPGTQDYEMSKLIIKAWTSFARDGVPPLIQNLQWPRVPVSPSDEFVNKISTSSVQYMRLDNPVTIIDEPFKRIGFWNSLNLTTFLD